ncbi:V-type proton ATPase proteolipid subunit [Blastocystis sp. subtype 4]|uniref:V-type proton ATPase proteolipid subunit n=2 Tax=Blastocystis sp. subtype 4 TaxID=944170 RepID=UPI0007115013|nr:V-type proton ATPase proteolipid subunit [Blastocystis sp. subtype 4]KNB43627.1 V-type proton ATPase proteolipid subunit [Blastocystis sp. subtype 4]|eukprot:XP_014527070.1 V-type proton ATPase proteolipid subunit [Blastocystis sp. subtype 4]
MLSTVFEAAVSDLCPSSAPFFGFMGVAASIIFANLGSAYGTAKAGVGVCSMGVFKPEAVMRNMLPVIMAGILGIYGLIASIIMVYAIKAPTGGVTHYSSFNGYGHLAAGLSCGLSCLAAGLSIGIAGDAGVRACGQQEKIFVGMILMLIFGEALALYGLIVAIVIVTVTTYSCSSLCCTNDGM